MRITDKSQGPKDPVTRHQQTRQFTTRILNYTTIPTNRVAVSPARVFVLTYMQRVTNADSKKKKKRLGGAHLWI
jgi:hypothetical protein